MQKDFVGFWSSGVYVCSWGEPITNTYEEKASLMLILPHLISNIFACYEGKCWMCVPVPLVLQVVSGKGNLALNSPLISFISSLLVRPCIR